MQPFSQDDFTTLISWVESPRLLLQFSGTSLTYPLTEAQLIENVSNVRRTVFIVLDSDTRERIGYAEVYKLIAKTSKLARILIGCSYRGLGYGRTLIQALLSHCFVHLKLKHLVLFMYMKLILQLWLVTLSLDLRRIPISQQSLILRTTHSAQKE